MKALVKVVRTDLKVDPLASNFRIEDYKQRMYCSITTNLFQFDEFLWYTGLQTIQVCRRLLPPSLP